jgi:hypothetical protein
MMANFHHQAGSTQVQLSGWANGIYIFRYRIGDEVGSLRLVLE